MISEAVGGSRDTGVSQQFRPPGTLRVQQHISSFEHPPDTPTTEPPDRHTRAARSRVSAFTNKAHFWCVRTHPQAVVACERRTKVASPVLTSEKLAVPYLAKPSHPNPPQLPDFAREIYTVIHCLFLAHQLRRLRKLCTAQDMFPVGADSASFSPCHVHADPAPAAGAAVASGAAANAATVTGGKMRCAMCSCNTALS